MTVRWNRAFVNELQEIAGEVNQMEAMDKLKEIIESALKEAARTEEDLTWGEVTEVPPDERAFGVTIDGVDLFITIDMA